MKESMQLWIQNLSFFLQYVFVLIALNFSFYNFNFNHIDIVALLSERDIQWCNDVRSSLYLLVFGLSCLLLFLLQWLYVWSLIWLCVFHNLFMIKIEVVETETDWTQFSTKKCLLHFFQIYINLEKSLLWAWIGR